MEQARSSAQLGPESGPALALIRSFTPKWTKYIPILPHAKQQLGMCLDHVEEGFYGGAAGGGKSIWLLMSALQYVDQPAYNAMIMRRTYAELSKPDALMDVARRWLYNTDAKWDGQNHTWRFPKGATLSFGYCDNEDDLYQYQSAAYQFIGFDEGTHFTARMYLYLSSRLRKLVGSNVPIRKRSASNPGGVGHEFFKDRFNPKEPWKCPPDRFCIPAIIADNPALSRADYEKRLMHLLPVDRERLMNGDWDVMEGGAVINRGWFKTFLKESPKYVIARGRGWDLAATGAVTPEDELNMLIKRTAGTRMSKTNEGLFVIEHCHAGKWAPGERDEEIEKIAKRDGYRVKVLLEQEPGSGGIAQNDTIKRRLRGFNVESVDPLGEKYVRLGPFASNAQLGKVAIVEGDWVEAYLQELHDMKHEPPKYLGYKDRGDSSSLVFGWLENKRLDTSVTPPPERGKPEELSVKNLGDANWRQAWPAGGNPQQPPGIGPGLVNNFGD